MDSWRWGHPWDPAPAPALGPRSGAAAAVTAAAAAAATAGPPVLVGERVLWLGSGSGIPQGAAVRWMGKLPEMGPSWTLGIELDLALPYGGIDGWWGGRRLFSCEPRRGLLVPLNSVVREPPSPGPGPPPPGWQAGWAEPQPQPQATPCACAVPPPAAAAAAQPAQQYPKPAVRRKNTPAFVQSLPLVEEETRQAVYDTREHVQQQKQQLQQLQQEVPSSSSSSVTSQDTSGTEPGAPEILVTQTPSAPPRAKNGVRLTRSGDYSAFSWQQAGPGPGLGYAASTSASNSTPARAPVRSSSAEALAQAPQTQQQRPSSGYGLFSFFRWFKKGGKQADEAGAHRTAVVPQNETAVAGSGVEEEDDDDEDFDDDDGTRGYYTGRASSYGSIDTVLSTATVSSFAFVQPAAYPLGPASPVPRRNLPTADTDSYRLRIRQRDRRREAERGVSLRRKYRLYGSDSTIHSLRSLRSLPHPHRSHTDLVSGGGLQQVQAQAQAQAQQQAQHQARLQARSQTDLTHTGPRPRQHAGRRHSEHTESEALNHSQGSARTVADNTHTHAHALSETAQAPADIRNTSGGELTPAAKVPQPPPTHPQSEDVPVKGCRPSGPPQAASSSRAYGGAIPKTRPAPAHSYPKEKNPFDDDSDSAGTGQDYPAGLNPFGEEDGGSSTPPTTSASTQSDLVGSTRTVAADSYPDLVVPTLGRRKRRAPDPPPGTGTNPYGDYSLPATLEHRADPDPALTGPLYESATLHIGRYQRYQHQHRRTVSDTATDKRLLVPAHVRGKRRAPTPPCDATGTGTLTSTTSTISAGTGKKKRPAPAPPGTLESVERELEEAERLRRGRLEEEKLHRDRLEKERLERERLEKERLERERLEKERLEKERLERERLENERIERERLEKDRLEKERLEKVRLEREKEERERRLEEERLERERLERELLELERVERDRLEKERDERRRLEREKLEREQLEKERSERERLEKELQKQKLEAERLEREKKETERLLREKERLEKENIERLEREIKLARETLQRERLEKEKLDRQLRLDKDRLDRKGFSKGLSSEERERLLTSIDKLQAHAASVSSPPGSPRTGAKLGARAGTKAAAKGSGSPRTSRTSSDVCRVPAAKENMAPGGTGSAGGGSGSGPVSPRPWYKRSSSTSTSASSHRDSGGFRDIFRSLEKRHKKADEEEWMPESGVPRCSGGHGSHGGSGGSGGSGSGGGGQHADATHVSRFNIFSRLTEDWRGEKRKSTPCPVTMLANISELDREAAEIVQEQHAKEAALQAKRDAEFYARPGRSDEDDGASEDENPDVPRKNSAKELISLFNAISNVTTTSLFPAAEGKRSIFGGARSRSSDEDHLRGWGWDPMPWLSPKTARKQGGPIYEAGSEAAALSAEAFRVTAPLANVDDDSDVVDDATAGQNAFPASAPAPAPVAGNTNAATPFGSKHQTESELRRPLTESHKGVRKSPLREVQEPLHNGARCDQATSRDVPASVLTNPVGGADQNRSIVTADAKKVNTPPSAVPEKKNIPQAVGSDVLRTVVENAKSVSGGTAAPVPKLVPAAAVNGQVVWVCPRCTLENPRWRFTCDACSMWRPAERRPVRAEDADQPLDPPAFLTEDKKAQEKALEKASGAKSGLAAINWEEELKRYFDKDTKPVTTSSPDRLHAGASTSAAAPAGPAESQCQQASANGHPMQEAGPSFSTTATKSAAIKPLPVAPYSRVSTSTSRPSSVNQTQAISQTSSAGTTRPPSTSASSSTSTPASTSAAVAVATTPGRAPTAVNTAQQMAVVKPQPSTFIGGRLPKDEARNKLAKSKSVDLTSSHHVLQGHMLGGQPGRPAADVQELRRARLAFFRNSACVDDDDGSEDLPSTATQTKQLMRGQGQGDRGEGDRLKQMLKEMKDSLSDRGSQVGQGPGPGLGAGKASQSEQKEVRAARGTTLQQQQQQQPKPTKVSSSAQTSAQVVPVRKAEPPPTRPTPAVPAAPTAPASAPKGLHHQGGPATANPKGPQGPHGLHGFRDRGSQPVVQAGVLYTSLRRDAPGARRLGTGTFELIRPGDFANRASYAPLYMNVLPRASAQSHGRPVAAKTPAPAVAEPAEPRPAPVALDSSPERRSTTESAEFATPSSSAASSSRSASTTSGASASSRGLGSRSDSVGSFSSSPSDRDGLMPVLSRGSPAASAASSSRRQTQSPSLSAALSSSSRASSVETPPSSAGRLSRDASVESSLSASASNSGSVSGSTSASASAFSPSRSLSVVSDCSEVDRLTEQLSAPQGIADFRAALNQTAHADGVPDANTLAVNRLLRRLEATIAGGHHQEAARLARDLARLKISCSVTRQRSQRSQQDTITVDMYVEDQASHQGPIPLQVTASMTVGELAAKVEREFQLPEHVQRWILGKQLANEWGRTLRDHDVTDSGCPVFLYLVAPEPDADVEGDGQSGAGKQPPQAESAPATAPTAPTRRLPPPPTVGRDPDRRGGWYYNYEEDRYSFCEDSDSDPSDTEAEAELTATAPHEKRVESRTAASTDTAVGSTPIPAPRRVTSPTPAPRGQASPIATSPGTSPVPASRTAPATATPGTAARRVTSPTPAPRAASTSGSAGPGPGPAPREAASPVPAPRKGNGQGQLAATVSSPLPQHPRVRPQTSGYRSQPLQTVLATATTTTTTSSTAKVAVSPPAAPAAPAARTPPAPQTAPPTAAAADTPGPTAPAAAAAAAAATAPAAASAAAPVAMASTSAAAAVDTSSTQQSPAPGSWRCPRCTLLNAGVRPGCAACTAERPSTAIAEGLDVAEAERQRDRERERQYQLLVNLERQDLIPTVEHFECPVCITDYGPTDGVVLRECLHNFCRTCLVHTVQFSEDAEVKCPYRDKEYACDGVLQDREIKALVPPALYEQHLAKSMAQAERKIQNAFHCKTPDCAGWCIFEDNVNEFRCPVCSATNCLTCQAIHAGANCAEYQAKLQREAADGSNEDARRTQAMLEEMVARGEAMSCPSCQVVLMKKWGCDWLRCSMCKTEICWVTRKPRWGPGGKGDTTGGCQCGVNGVKCHPKCNYCH